MERKVCADCGTTSLETEPRCWACSGTTFVPPGTPLAGERTVAFASGAERTLAVPGPGRGPLGWLLAGGGVVAALVLCGIGFWIGRASASDAQAKVKPEPVLAQSIALPPPPTSLTPVSPAPYRMPAFTSIRDPMVTVRPTLRPLRPQVRQPKPAPVQRYAFGASGVPYGPPASQRAPQPQPRPRMHATVQATQPPPPEPRSMPTPPASDTTAVISLRNDASTPINVIVEGNGTRTATIGARSSIPLTLPPGTYQLRAVAGGVSSMSSSLALAPNRSYGLVVSRSRDTLVITEPALNGH